MNKTYISIIVLVIIAGFLFFVLKNKKSEAPMPPAIETAEESAQATNTNTETGSEMEGIVANGEVKEFTVSGDNFSFKPSTITVKKGDKVKITFINSEGFHDWVVDEFGAATKQTQAPTTEIIEFTADKAGSFEYYCSVGSHRAMGMVGTLVVEE